MSEMNIKTEVKVADDAINIIAGIAATSVSGVHSLGEGMTFKTIPFIGSKNLKKGIVVVKNDDDNSVSVKITVTLKNGAEIRKVCSNIQEKIKDSIESMLDITVREVIVKVAKIDDV